MSEEKESRKRKHRYFQQGRHYEEALNVLGEYVTITSSQQEEQMDLRMQ